MSQAARPPEAGELGLAWPGEPTGLAGLASWLQAGPGTTLHAIYEHMQERLELIRDSRWHVQVVQEIC